MVEFEANDSQKDIIDLFLTAARKNKVVVDEQGRELLEEGIDSETIYYMTRIVPSETFAYFVKELKVLEGLASQAQFNLPVPMANVISMQIKDLVDAYKKSIDAKSSETIKDKKFAQPSLIHILNNRRTEKFISVEDKAKKGVLQSFFGENNQEE